MFPTATKNPIGGRPVQRLVPGVLILCAILAILIGGSAFGRHTLAAGLPRAQTPLVASSPQASPTAVLAGLGEQLDASGRYYSNISPYSLHAPWPAQSESTLDGQFIDQFGSEQEHIAVITAHNAVHWSSAQGWSFMVRQLKADNAAPHDGPTVELAGQKTVVVLATAGSVRIALAAFATPERLWAIQLDCPARRWASDVRLFLQVLHTFRLEQGS